MCSNVVLKNRIDLILLLQQVNDYILLKIWGEFPQYFPGSDVDLIVFNREDALLSIYAFYNSFIGETGEMKVTDIESYCHIDFLFDGELDLRIDLIDNFNFFEKLDVKPAFTTKLFIDRKQRIVGEHKIYIPCEEDDLTIRYFEFLEWFDRRPDKIKHLDYICSVKDEDVRRRFFNNTHLFIQFKRKTWPQNKIIGYPSENPINTLHSRKDAIRQILRGLRYIFLITLRPAIKIFYKGK